MVGTKSKATPVACKTILDNLILPLIVCKACYNSDGVIYDIQVTYVNNQYLQTTQNFTNVGQNYLSLKTQLPHGIDWFEICTKTIETGVPYEGEYYATRTGKSYHMIVQKCSSDSCSFSLLELKKTKLEQYRLSNRQMLIAKKILERKKYSVIANEVFISVPLVKKECKQIFEITGVHLKNEFLIKFA